MILEATLNIANDKLYIEGRKVFDLMLDPDTAKDCAESPSINKAELEAYLEQMYSYGNANRWAMSVLAGDNVYHLGGLMECRSASDKYLFGMLDRIISYIDDSDDVVILSKEMWNRKRNINYTYLATEITVTDKRREYAYA